MCLWDLFLFISNKIRPAPLHGQGLEAKNALYLHEDVEKKKEPAELAGGVWRMKKREIIVTVWRLFFPFRNLVARKELKN